MWLAPAAPLQTSRWSDSIRFGNRFAGWFRRTRLFIGRPPPLVLFLCSFQLTRVSYLSRLASLRTRQNRPTFPLSFRVLVRQPWPPSRLLVPTMCIFLRSSSLRLHDSVRSPSSVPILARARALIVRPLHRLHRAFSSIRERSLGFYHSPSTFYFRTHTLVTTYVTV